MPGLEVEQSAVKVPRFLAQFSVSHPGLLLAP